ncbi:putative efflux protein, MATE family [Sporobacter termitidis DSM 10068]|uniref:Probable multidrug resistance protein NorM n=1 Tax=Sporobacter termitidis DSM 10068 TaxID=1123282 RepID=A0A1M5VKA6_9FIRM|nr:MATE family efflux transporter [Sporobacter termitidis]SHH75712.1 putative efflux protein, MATE family [Sporobacter termitidis DSM 10068]
MVQNDYLLRGGIAGALVRFAVPVLLSSLLQVFYSAIDLLIVGKFATTADMSAVAVSSGVMTTVTLGVAGLTTGLTVLIGQFVGGGNQGNIKRIVGSSVVFFAALSAVLTILLAFLSGPIVTAMKTPAEAVLPAWQFLFICSFGTVFIVGYNVVSSAFRGLGNSKTPLIFVAAACGVNVVLDLIFIIGLGMGAAGAALATVTAQASSLLFSVLYIKKRKDTGLRIGRADLRPDFRLLWSMIKIGGPIALQEVLVNFSFVLITAVVNGMGLYASAAAGTVEKIMSFLSMPTLAVSMAVATMSAHNFGALQYDRARKCLWTGIGLSLLFAAVFTAFCWAQSTALPSIFSKDPEVVREASLYLKTYVLDSLGIAFVFNFNGYFSSCNKSLFSMAHSLLTTLLIRIPFVLIAGGMAGVTLSTIGCAAPLTSLGSLILCLIYFMSLRRKLGDGAGAPVPAAVSDGGPDAAP